MFSILIVDEDRFICKYLRDLLLASGLSMSFVRMAHSMHDAIACLRTQEIDLLISENRTKTLDGTVLIQQAMLIQPWMQAIIVSSNESYPFVRLAMRLGVRDYLTKPVNKEHFLDSVRDVLQKTDRSASQEEVHPSSHNRIVEKAKEYIHQNYHQKGLTLQRVAQKNHVSPNYLSYLFKKNTGYNFWEYVIQLRMEESKKLILNTDLRRYEIAERVGYESPEHFSKIFKKKFGISPSVLKSKEQLVPHGIDRSDRLSR